MDKTKLMKNFRKPDVALLFAKVLDRALLCAKRGRPAFSNFQPPTLAVEFIKVIESEGICNIVSFGGAMGCERLMLGFYSEYDSLLESDFPIDAVEIVHDNNKLTHRDFLGSILGIGINREKLGDIFVFPNKAIAFLDREISDFVMGSLTSVGRTSVSLEIIKNDCLIAPFIDSLSKDITVSSMRLDTVIATAFNLSRSTALKLIESEKVFINWQAAKSASKTVELGDNITLRGFGRGKIEAINGQTRKGNISISILMTSLP
ncbi:MAG: YlmH/Sll1252 family protein [Defluviitaleaceae bacterium]|nr:YlmH/Sll1252 family protein [Defluviitaleaceae bacterium]